MLDGGLPSATRLPLSIVVGRTISAPTVSDVRNGQVTLTYTVYNQDSNPEAGVLLTTTLAPGVSYRSATQPPDQSGQTLAWSLGTIPGYDRASVSVTVALASPTVLQLDGGAAAYATLAGGSVFDTAPAAALQNRVIAPSLLASTPDANTADPFVQEKAAELDYDPQRIFDYLHTQVGYNSYVGSVRGARGTLWSGAGNALDVASLGVALMRASGIPAQYTSGTLNTSQAQSLIVSMFPTGYQFIGHIAPGTRTGDPANDPDLLAQTRAHDWFQFDTGGGLRDADPLMPGATIGQSFTSAAGTFAEVPQARRSTTRITLVAETYSPASALFGAGSGLDTAVVLDRTFNDVDLVGHPLTIGNHVSSSAIGALVFSAQTNTYTPFIDIAGDLFNQHDDTVIEGTPYQEVLTNFPLGSRVLTGLFIDMTLTGADGASRNLRSVMADRLGPAARQGGSSGISFDPQGPPLVTPYTLTTINILPGRQHENWLAAMDSGLDSLRNELKASEPRGNPAVDEGAAVDPLKLAVLMASSRLTIAQFLALSDLGTYVSADKMGVAAYYAVPRVTIVRMSVDASTTPARFREAVDLRQNEMTVIVAPGQNVATQQAFEFTRGVNDTYLETLVLARESDQGGSSLTTPVSADSIFRQAELDNIPLVLLYPGEQDKLGALHLNDDARALISQALGNNQAVMVPSRAVVIDGQPRAGWYEIDLDTGATIGVLDDGGHQAITERTAALMIGFKTGLLAGIFTSPIGFFLGKVHPAFGLGESALGSLFPFFTDPLQFGKFAPGTFGWFGVGWGLGFIIGNLLSTLLLKELHIDPPLPNALIEPNWVLPPDNSASGSLADTSPLTAGAVAGTLTTADVRVSGGLRASWTQGAGASLSLGVTSLSASSATVTGAGGSPIGQGLVSLASGALLSATAGGSFNASLSGQGSLAFYGPAESRLGVGGEWRNYSGSLDGSVLFSITVPDGVLSLNGRVLPAGTYTIAASSTTLAGSGSMSVPNFAGAASLSTTNGTVSLGSGTGPLSVGGQALGTGVPTTLDGYTGSVVVSANGNGTDTATLNGTAANVLQVAGASVALATDQNTPLVFTPDVLTSLGGPYTIGVLAPEGWQVSVDEAGHVTVVPAGGLPGGTYPIQIEARSTTNSNLLARTTLGVTITPTSPGLALGVTYDPIYTVPYDGAELPTAFQASIRNLGPTADTFLLTSSNVPAGFRLLQSRGGVTVPAGKTGILAVYLEPQPGQALPAPGTVLTFEVTATSTSDPTITSTELVTFTVPAIEALSLTVSTASASTYPGGPVTVTLTITNAGNVAQPVVALTSATSAGLSLSGLSNASLAPGQSVTRTLTLAPDAGTPLNTTLDATITASFGSGASPLTRGLLIPVRVVVPGAVAIADASVAARALGDPALASRLDELSTALSNLVQSPSDPVARSQSLASLDAVIRLLQADTVLNPSTAALAADRATLAVAVTAQDVQQAVGSLGHDLDAVASILGDRVAHGLTLGLVTNTAVIQPQTPVSFQLVLQNTGTRATTYDLSVTGLPAGVTASFSQDSITLQPGQGSPGTIGVPLLTLTLTSGSTTELAAFSFRVLATAREAPGIAAAVVGSLSTRNEFLSVASVKADPPFANPGGSVEVSARILNAVNQVRDARASYVLKDAGGNLVFTSTPVAFTLSVQTTLTTVDLGSLDTSGFARGTYTIVVTVATPDGDPIPGGSGTGSLLVGSPVSGTIQLDQQTLPAGTGTVTTTLQVQSQSSLIGPLGLVSQTDLAGAGGVAHGGHYVYASGSAGIGVYDVSNPLAPSLVRTFGSSSTQLEVQGGKLYALTRGGFADRFYLRIYSLADPANPQLLGSAKFTDGQEGIPYTLAWHMVVTDTHVYVSLWSFTFLIGGQNDIKYQVGDLISIDTTDPTAPVFVSALKNTYGTFLDGIGRFLNVDVSGGDGPEWGVQQLDANTLLLAGSTVHGDNTQDGQGIVQVVDISDPAHMNVVKTLVIPNTVQAVGLSIDGDRALVTGSTTGWEDLGTLDFTGDMVLAVLDVSDHRNPVILGQQTLARSSRGPYDHYTASLGNNVFVFSSRYQTAADEAPALFVVDASDPQNLVVQSTSIPASTMALDGQGNYVYSTSTSGLLIHQIQASDAIPVTARVQVPTGTGVSIVPGSFSIPPAQIIPGAGFETLVFNLSLTSGSPSQAITWQSTVAGLNPGERRRVVDGATLDFNSQGTDGQATLAPLDVAGEQILTLDPGTRTARPGETANYTLHVHNPTAQELTYTLSIQGVPGTWSGLPATVTVAAGSESVLPFTLRSDVFTPVGDLGFTVLAVAGGVSGSVGGRLVLAGTPSAADANAHGVVATIIPGTASAGQGTAAVFTARIVNTGSVVETYTLAAILPPGVAAAFSQATVTVTPGASNYRDVRFTLTPAAGTLPGAVAFSLTATSTSDAAVTSTAAGTLNVLRGGVKVTLDPPSGTPGGVYQLTVTNTGDATDTFDLALGGPAALIATLGGSRVTLAPGASRVIPIQTGGVNFALPGTLSLMAMATSQADANVRAGASSALAIPTVAGLTASLAPPSATLMVPGPASFTIVVNNTGNAEDTYSAEIIGTSGPITARLFGLDGTPTSLIPAFRLPALASGAIPLSTQLNGPGRGTVTIRITSLSTGQVTIVTAEVAAPAAEVPIDGPRVVQVQRYGIHMSPTTLVLSFDQPLDPARAQDVRAYQLRDPQGRLLVIRRAVYDAAANTVTLYPAQRINLHQRYTLTVDGASPRALTDPQGRPLDGNADGQPGGNYSAPITWRNAVMPPSWKKAVAPRPTRVRPLRPAPVLARGKPGVVRVAAPGKLARRLLVAQKAH